MIRNRNRREFFKATAALTTGFCVGSSFSGSLNSGNPAQAETVSGKNKEEKDTKKHYPREKVCFNTSCILNYNLGIEEELELTAAAGFRAVEVWSQRIGVFLDQGGKLADLKKRADDLGLTIVNGIGFATWIMDEPDKRQEGLETMQREMNWIAELGGKHIAAPAAGPWNQRIEGIDVCAERFRTIMELGGRTGVQPMLELWGTSPTLSKLSDVVAIALATGRSDAALLLDAYHLYRGGNSFDSLALLNGRILPVFHLNDYPAAPVDELTDQDRVFPGDGICPTSNLLRILHSAGFDGYLSLELFNPEYQKQMKPLELIKTGFSKMNRALDAAEI